MEKNDSKNGKTFGREDNGFNREDSGRNSNKTFAPFAKDKRKRITRVEKTEPRRRSESDGDRPYRREGSEQSGYRGGDNRDQKPYRREEQPARKPYSGGNERHSYNPNFTKDNRLRDENRFNRTDYPGRDNDRSERRDFNRDDRYAKRTPGRDSGQGGDRYNKPYQKEYAQGGDRYKKPYQKDYNQTDDRYNRSSTERDFNRTDSRPPARKSYGGKPAFDKPYGQGKPSKYGAPGRSQGGYKSGDRMQKPGGLRPRTNAKTDNGRFSDGSYPTFPAPVIEDEIRLNRYIAAAGKSSRREADELIKEGRVTVNGEVVTEMGAKVKAGDIIQMDGETIRSEKKVYILMNKPKGFVTTLEDPFAEKTVMDLLTNACKERVYPVGRLDKNSLGVLLVTNDGDLTTQLTHPSYSKKKIYQVTLDKPLTKADMQDIADGITLDDGEIHADEISYVSESKKEVGIEVHSGRNRIVRRIFEHFGYKVMKLDRVYFAGLTKKNLKRGQWRFLTPKEVEILKSGLYE